MLEQSGSFRQSLTTLLQGPLDPCAQLLQWLQVPVSQTLLTPLEVLELVDELVELVEVELVEVLDEPVEVELLEVFDELVVEPLDELPSPELLAVPPWPVVPAPLSPVPPIDPPLPMPLGLDPTAHESGIAIARPTQAIRNGRCGEWSAAWILLGSRRGGTPGSRRAPGHDADISHARLHLASALLAHMPDRVQLTR